MKWLKFVIILLILGVGGIYFWKQKASTAVADTPQKDYATTVLERMDLINLVSATGELSAREMVDVGTQVSGIIEEVFVDYNDMVEAGQLIATVDHSVLDSQVKGAEASLIRTKAQLKKAQSDYDRYKVVYENEHISEHDFLNYEIALETAQAQVMDAEASMDRASRNRSYAEIYAPISGVVIDRDVEKGQTVAASFNTPTLFIIAEDLSKMEIIANVDETDIGQIEEGQRVTFTVAAYPDDTFEGDVTQMRLQPTVVQNVVNYQVVIETDNPDGLLLPGMTATIDFIVDEVEDILAVPVSALNLSLSAEMREVMKKRREEMMKRFAGKQGEGNVGEQKNARTAGGFGGGSGFPMGGGMMPGGFGGGMRDQAGASDRGTIWIRNSDGELLMLPVRKGVTDGIHVEVLPLRRDGETLKEGIEIITKVNNPISNGGVRGPQDGSPPPGGGGPGGPGGGLRRLGF